MSVMCGLAYLIGTSLAGLPLAWVVISGFITTVALCANFLVLRRSRNETGAIEPAPAATING